MLNVGDIDRTARHEGVVSTSFLVPGHLTQGLLSYLYGLPLSSSNGKYFSFKTKKKKKKRIFLMFFAFSFSCMLRSRNIHASRVSRLCRWLLFPLFTTVMRVYKGTVAGT